MSGRAVRGVVRLDRRSLHDDLLEELLLVPLDAEELHAEHGAGRMGALPSDVDSQDREVPVECESHLSDGSHGRWRGRGHVVREPETRPSHADVHGGAGDIVSVPLQPGTGGERHALCQAPVTKDDCSIRCAR